MTLRKVDLIQNDLEKIFNKYPESEFVPAFFTVVQTFLTKQTLEDKRKFLRLLAKKSGVEITFVKESRE